jgi:nucleoside-diphosphate-sugar epimerase
VTGGTGFIGRNLVQALIAEGYEVDVTTWMNEAVPKGASSVGTLQQYVGSFCRMPYETVFHLAANNDTQSSDKIEMFAANTYSSIALFNRAKISGVRNFVYASSAAVYGSSLPQGKGYSEKWSKPMPSTAYASSKLAFEEYVKENEHHAFIRNENFNCMGLRFSNVYGPGEGDKGSRQSMVGQIIRKAIARSPVTLFGKGEEQRDWIHVFDIVELCLSILNVTYKSFKNLNGIFNVGSGIKESFNTIVSLVGNHFPMRIKYVPCPFPKTFQTCTLLDITLANETFGYQPQYTLEKGIHQYLTELKQSFKV